MTKEGKKIIWAEILGESISEEAGLKLKKKKEREEPAKMREPKGCNDWCPQTYKYLLNEWMGDPKNKD